MSPFAKGLGLLFGIPATLAVVFFTYFTVTGEDRMKAVCSQLKPGATPAQVKEFMLEYRLSGASKDVGVSFLGDKRSYGRHACMITMEAGVVKSAQYNYAD